MATFSLPLESSSTRLAKNCAATCRGFVSVVPWPTRRVRASATAARKAIARPAENNFVRLFMGFLLWWELIGKAPSIRLVFGPNPLGVAGSCHLRVDLCGFALCLRGEHGFHLSPDANCGIVVINLHVRPAHGLTSALG